MLRPNRQSLEFGSPPTRMLSPAVKARRSDGALPMPIASPSPTSVQFQAQALVRWLLHNLLLIPQPHPDPVAQRTPLPASPSQRKHRPKRDLARTPPTLQWQRCSTGGSSQSSSSSI